MPAIGTTGGVTTTTESGPTVTGTVATGVGGTKDGSNPSGDVGILCVPDSPPESISPPSISPTSGTIPLTVSTTQGSWSSCNQSITEYHYAWSVGGTTSSITIFTAYQGLTSAVEACNASGCSGYVGSSNAGYYSSNPVNNPPNKPTEQVFPDDEFVGPTGPVRVKYSDPDGNPGSLRYRIYLESNGSLVRDWTQSGIASGAYPNAYVPTALSNTDYYWNALPTDNQGQIGPVSDNFYFSVTSPPSVPSNLIPAGTTGSPYVLSTPNPTLQASAVDPDAGDPVGIRFRVTSNPDCVNGIVVESANPQYLPTSPSTSGQTASWRVPDGKLKDGQTYYWCAMATDLHAAGADSAWSAVRGFTIRIPTLGSREYWPMWSRGPFAVNQATGNLVLTMPSPSYSTGVGDLGISVAYNSQDTRPDTSGLGPGWTLGVSSGVPLKLIDHSAFTGAEQFAAIERVSADGSSDYYSRVGTSSIYVPGPGDPSLLVRNTDASGALVSWTLTDGDGSSYSFGNVASNNAYTLTAADVTVGSAGSRRLTYAFDAPTGHLISASAVMGPDTVATLTLNWACPGYIVCVTGPDSLQWLYAGTTSGLTSVTLQAASKTRALMKATYGTSGTGSGKVVSIQNAADLDSLLPVAQRDSNLSANYLSAHQIVISYDSNSRVSSVTDGPLRDRVGGSFTQLNPTWSFAYTCSTGNTLPVPGATHPGGTLPAAAEGCTEMRPPNQQPSGTKVARVWYDQLRQPLKMADVVDGVNGKYVLNFYNGSHKLLWSEDEDKNPTDNTYDAVDGTVTSAAGPDPDGGGPLGRVTTTYRYDETAPGTPTSAGSALRGLKASYFANATLAGRPTAAKTDATVDFAWAGAAPAPGVPADGFSVRWTGNLDVATAGEYFLQTVANGSSRLIIDGLPAIDTWAGPQTISTPACSPQLWLTAGKHSIVLEYKDLASTAELHLKWTTASTCTGTPTANAIPTTSLLPAYLNQTSTVSDKNTDSGSGLLAYSHFAEPWRAVPDYSLQTVNGQQLITSYDYDSYDRQTAKWMPKGNASSTINGTTGDLSKISQDTNYRIQYTYYGNTEQLTLNTHCGGGSSASQMGLPKAITYPGVTPTQTLFDSGGRPFQVTNGKGVACKQYDVEGRRIGEKIWKPANSTSTPDNNLVVALDPNGRAVSTNETTLGATPASQTLTADANEATWPISQTDSYGATLTSTFDKDGNAVSRTVTMPGGTPAYTSTYVYNAGSQLTGQTDPAGRLYSFFYDSRGNDVGVNYPTQFSSPALSSFTSLGPTGWVNSVFNRDGAVTSPGGTEPGTAPTSGPADSSPIADLTYTYFQNGQRKSEQRKVGSTTTTTSYVYDALSRLEQVSLPDGTSRKYCLDRDSNRTEIRAAATEACGSASPAESYLVDPSQSPGIDQLTRVTRGSRITNFTYNSDGDTTSRGGDTLAWDTRGRFSGGTFSGQTLAYAYDPSGFRRSRAANITYAGEILASQPAGFWRLGETSGTALADTVGGNNAALSGGYTLGQTGALASDSDKAVLFNGTTGRAEGATTVKLGSSSSAIEAWFKTSSATSEDKNIARHGGSAASGNPRLKLSVGTTNKLTGEISDSTTTTTLVSAAAVNNGAWHHGVLSRSGSSMTLFLDGVQVAVASFAGGAVDGSAPRTTIGSTVNGTGNFFGGTVDEVAVYKHALSASEVLAHFTRGQSGPLASATNSYLAGGLVETNSSNAITLFDVDGPSGDLAHYTAAPTSGSTNLTFAFYDGHGDLAAEVTRQGNIAGTYTSDAFGAPQQGLSTSLVSERFAGRWDKKDDPASNIIEMGARPYDPTLGRFLAVDAVDGGSANNYDYARQDPINAYDVTGTVTPPCPGHRRAYDCARGKAWLPLIIIPSVFLAPEAFATMMAARVLVPGTMAAAKYWVNVPKFIGLSAAAAKGSSSARQQWIRLFLDAQARTPIDEKAMTGGMGAAKYYLKVIGKMMVRKH